MWIYLLGSAFTLWMAVECVRRGDTARWLWIVLLFGPIGSGVYFFTEVLPALRISWRPGPRPATDQEVRGAELEAERLDKPELWAELAALRRSRGEWASAKAAALRALERAPEDLHARHELGLALYAQGQHEAAAAALTGLVAAQLDFDRGEAALVLARCRRATGDLAGARDLMERLTRQRRRPELLFELASLQALMADREAARGTLEQLLAEASAVPDYLRREVRPWVRKASQALDRLS